MQLTNREFLIYASLLYEGNWDKIYRSIVNKELKIDNEEIIYKIRSLKCGVLTMFDENYPEYLHNIQKPPFVLYYYGDISLIHNTEKNMSVIGSREPSEYGRIATARLVHEIAEKYVIVSGLAIGIDAIAHKSALEVGGKTIAVLGNGIEYCYLKTNEGLYWDIRNNKDCLVISELPLNTKPNKEKLPERNRLVAAFGQKLIITEAKSHSGTAITTYYALNMGKDVMVLPTHAFNDSLCNALIREGAILINSFRDFYDEVGEKYEENLLPI